MHSHFKHKVFPTSLHPEVTELVGSQLHGSQPLPLARFQWLGAQWSHARPTTFCRHWHWPVARWHTQSSRSIHWLRSVPRKLHVHSEGEERLNKLTDRPFFFWSIANVQHRAFSFHSESDSHSCSFVGKHPRKSRSCRCHSWDLQCCKGTCYTVRSDCHRHSRLTCLCCCYTGTAGSALLPGRGYRNNPGHIPHIGHLGWDKEEEIAIIYGQSREEEEDMMAKIVWNFLFCAMILG